MGSVCSVTSVLHQPSQSQTGASALTKLRKEGKQAAFGPVRVQGNQLEVVLGLCWPDSLEAARAGCEGVPLEELPPLSRQQRELAMEVLKILFNITFDKGRRSVDEVQTPATLLGRDGHVDF